MSMELRTFVWKFYAFRFLASMAFFAPVITVFFTDYGGLLLWQAQFIQAWFMFWIVVSEIPSGAFADAFGRRTSMLTGVTITIAGLLVYGMYPAMWVFLTGEFLMALGLGFMSGADTAMLRGMLSRANAMSSYGRAVRVGRICSLSGISVGALCGGFIVQQLGYAATMWMTAIPYAFAMVLLFTVKEFKVEKKDPYVEVIKEGVLIFRKSRALQQVTLNMLVVSTAAYFVIWYYQVILKRTGVAVTAFGAFHVMLTLAQIAVLSGNGWLVKVLGSRERELQLAAFLTGIGLLVGIWVNLYAALVFIALAGGFGLSRSETMADEIADFVPEHRHATVSSTISMLRRGATAVLNIVIGVIATYSFNTALVILALLAFSALLIGLPKKVSV